MKTLILSTCALVLSSFVLVQMSTEADARSRYKKRGATISSSQNNTGGRAGRVISRGLTGADTINRSSAAGGNASQPSRAVGTGSAGGSGGSAGGS
ncbi:hypothetical protein [Methylobacterium iners]|uniref:Uncharacterized protein n=1 Tax=Methylobacterium iners TaxID=418707 RepID=A0ABQ4RW10_9HYPH|nr:hypothetical protein [Methylobacterium iners]GJD94157.1 hypothetical protein OCOJLMKI_1359 [Methylobacterium iners]